MANQEHFDILRKGVEVWNQWREEHPHIKPDLRGADLRGINLYWANLNGANLRKVNFRGANLHMAHLKGVDLTGANLIEADLHFAQMQDANLSRANLRKSNLHNVNLENAHIDEAKLYAVNLSRAHLDGAHFHGSDLRKAHLHEAKLQGADLSGAILSNADLSEANLVDCSVYAISAWNVDLSNTIQSGLIITLPEEQTITVDNLEVAQFIYLLLNNEKIRSVIDTITSKVVLILGRFIFERKEVLDALKNELYKQNYVPVLFDFKGPESRDVTETITALARMSRFIIADISDPKSIPQELAFIVPTLPSVPVQPLLQNSQREYGMFEYFTRFPWVLPLYHYTDQESLLQY